MRFSPALFLVLSAFFATTARGDGEMWMPQQVPALGEELKAMGLQLDPNSFADLTGFPMGAVVWTGGCSAAFVSDDGLIVTNHHCVDGSLQYNSTAERDLLTDGFLARTRGEELHASPNARVYVTTDIDDVTKEIVGNMPAGISDQERAELIDDRRKQMVIECEQSGDVRCWVRSFFGGESFLRLTALIIRDVRLVYAPAQSIGNFGGEVDNWMWPRHTGDFGFYRAYVGPDGKPADHSPENVPYQPSHHLKMSTRDLDEEDLVLLAGYPGSTSRLVTADEVRIAEQITMPREVRLRTELVDILDAQANGNRDVQIANASRIRSLNNYKKKYTGVLTAFSRDGLLDQKLNLENELAAFYGANPERADEYAALRREYRQLLEREQSTDERDAIFRWLYTASPLLEQANRLVRTATEREKPDGDREEGYQQRDWPRIQADLRRTQQSIHVPSDRAGLRWVFAKALDLPSDQRIDAIDAAVASAPGVTQDERLEALLDDLYANTQMNDLDTRLAWAEADRKSLLKQSDQFVAMAARLRTLGDTIDDETSAREGAQYRLRPMLIAAQREMQDGRLAPDANSTLRVSFGTVRGYEARDAVYYRAQSTMDGILQKYTGEPPFDSPARQIQLAKDRRFGPYTDPDLGTLPVGFLSTCSVTNGSSGTSALNAYGEIIGLAFDMNWEGVAADWVVNEDVVRTIQVDSRYMLWVMDAVDGAHNLLQEMGLGIHFPEAANLAAPDTGP